MFISFVGVWIHLDTLFCSHVLVGKVEEGT